MAIEEIYNSKPCKGIDANDIDTVVSFIRNDGFSVEDFLLFSAEGGVWEFVKNSAPQKGFIIYYNPSVVNEPIPQYQLKNGNVYYSFDARNITEAYILHNHEISDDEYDLLKKEYCKTEQKRKKIIQEYAHRFGNGIIGEIFNCTPEWLIS